MTANSVVNQIFQSESFVLQKGLNCPKSTIQGVGTPESLFLYKTHDSMQVSTPESLFLYKTHDSMQLVHQKAFSCTKPTIQCSWYTRKPFPVPNPRFKALVHQKAFSCTKSMIQCSWYTRKPFPVQNPRFNAVGTPESLFLYQIQSSN